MTTLSRSDLLDDLEMTDKSDEGMAQVGASSAEGEAQSQSV